jgi:hypothetical protein
MNQLILKELLGDCKHIASSTCTSKSSYECISLSSFYIFDNNPVKVVDVNERYQLTVKNDANQEICLVKTDKCLFTNEHKKCDCILFSQNKAFFIEISNSSAGQRGKKRKDAVEQLSATIDKLRENNIDLSSYNSKAIICFEREHKYPAQPSKNTQKAIFQEKYNTDLEEGNEIAF